MPRPTQLELQRLARIARSHSHEARINNGAVTVMVAWYDATNGTRGQTAHTVDSVHALRVVLGY